MLILTLMSKRRPLPNRLIPPRLSKALLAIPIPSTRMTRLPTTTANTDCPEQRRAKREDKRNPVQRHHLRAEGEMYTIRFQDGVKRAREDGEEDRACEGREEGEECCGGADEGCSAASPAGADREQADDDIGEGGEEGDGVGDEHPLRHVFVYVESLLKFGGDLALETGAF